jgi:hypothetical protein
MGDRPGQQTPFVSACSNGYFASDPNGYDQIPQAGAQRQVFFIVNAKFWRSEADPGHHGTREGTSIHISPEMNSRNLTEFFQINLRMRSICPAKHSVTWTSIRL